MLHNPDGTYHQDGDARGSDPTANRSESWWFNIKNASNCTDISNESHINLFRDYIQAGFVVFLFFFWTNPIKRRHTDDFLVATEVNAGRTEEQQRLKINENHVSIELIAHSAPCSSNSYTSPGYGGAWQSYATQSLGQSHLNSMLPAQMAEAPVYVNAKQYHGILRRRQSRAKAELEKKPNKVRRPYLHESRHLHAMKRERGCGGRFLSKNIAETTNHKASPNGTLYFDEREEVKEFPMMIRDLRF